MTKPPTRTRSAGDPWKTAEAAFKTATTKPAAPTPKKPSLPGVKEMVTLRIDRDVLDFFQEEGPGWQERINEALRKAAGK
ncbi:MAG TPA: BrnA antitoxin family protein [Microvirga sp.]|jgi:uncharacterized protein (DUF4415 family)|nr:BrnA antitoxin family protein [Microvirga sp.]